MVESSWGNCGGWSNCWRPVVVLEKRWSYGGIVRRSRWWLWSSSWLCCSSCGRMVASPDYFWFARLLNYGSSCSSLLGPLWGTFPGDCPSFHTARPMCSLLISPVVSVFELPYRLSPGLLVLVVAACVSFSCCGPAFTRTWLIWKTETFPFVCALHLHANGEFAPENDYF